MDTPDAAALWTVIEPLVLAADPADRSVVRLRTASGDVVERPLQP